MFRSFKGVTDTVVGYTGGTTPWPTYSSIGDHTEAIRVEFDPTLISYAELVRKVLEKSPPFMPQGRSQQYQSAIWYHSEAQESFVKNKIQALEEKRNKKATIRIEPADKFYRAEEYHQQYLAKMSRKRFG
mmetsp:Transcript_10312/g.11848  ORF Transcript_10312/g.11848 Transcript_10312/m.11848 type:complete len:130 (+) Transcript_10312:287-676(+)